MARWPTRGILVSTALGILSGAVLSQPGFAGIVFGPFVGFSLGAMGASSATRHRITFGIAVNVLAVVACVCTQALQLGYDGRLSRWFFERHVPGTVFVLLFSLCVPGYLGSLLFGMRRDPPGDSAVPPSRARNRREAGRPTRAAAVWFCPKCTEAVPVGFDVCWSCGTDRSGVPEESFRPAVGFTPQCEWCGYLLFGLDSEVCPECGERIDRTKKDTIRDVGEAGST